MESAAQMNKEVLTESVKIVVNDRNIYLKGLHQGVCIFKHLTVIF